MSTPLRQKGMIKGQKKLNCTADSFSEQYPYEIISYKWRILAISPHKVSSTKGVASNTTHRFRDLKTVIMFDPYWCRNALTESDSGITDHELPWELVYHSCRYWRGWFYFMVIMNMPGEGICACASHTPEKGAESVADSSWNTVHCTGKGGNRIGKKQSFRI